MSRRLEIGLLLALCIFLPLYEAPKNLAWLAYALVWLANRARTRDFGGRWDLWDTLIVAWLANQGRWELALAFSATMFAIAAVCWLFINPRHVIVYAADDRRRLQEQGVLG